MDFFASQERARRNTGRLIVLYVLAVAAIIALVYVALSAFFVASSGQGRQHGPPPAFWNPELFGWVTGITLVVVAVATFAKIAELSSGGVVVAEALGGRLLNTDSRDADERKLLNVVEEMAIASGTAVPSVYLLDRERGINAFAAGHTVDGAVIGVTRGCAQELNRDQLQGVIAHEFSHILHGDMRLNIRLVGVLHGILVIGLIGSILVRNAAYVSRGRSRNNAAMAMMAFGAALYVIGSLGTLFGRLIQAAVSRQREFLADASAVSFTRNPDGIAGALKRIGATAPGSRLHAAKVAEYRHLYFTPGTSEFLSMLATHPPLAERIRRIEPRWDGKFPEPAPPREEPAPAARPARKGPLAGADFSRRVIEAAVLGEAVARVGRPGGEHLEHAQGLIDRIPAPLKDAVHTLHGARAVVCATLVDLDKESRDKQMRYLEEQGGKLRDDVVDYVPLVHRAGPEVRIPLIDLAIPVLRRMNRDEYDALMRDVDFLSRTDRMIEPFEWVLGRILRHHLEPQFTGRAAPSGNQSLAALRGAIEALLSQLARSGQSEREAVERAFELGRARVADAGSLSLRPPQECTLEALDAAVDALARLAPLPKKAVLEACAATIGADGKVTLMESELLRGISDVLGCPMPPIPGVA